MSGQQPRPPPQQQQLPPSPPPPAAVAPDPGVVLPAPPGRQRRLLSGQLARRRRRTPGPRPERAGEGAAAAAEAPLPGRGRAGDSALPRSWSPKDKFSYIGLSQNNLRAHYEEFTTQQAETIVSALVKTVEANMNIMYKDMVAKVQEPSSLREGSEERILRK
ncbi:Mitochondrial Calcium Uniporter Regulator 1 [Manis pentadactyla]|nr:Mitochondrial Calcium Uniporter Regulator 1 [Manis pentadactyla]